MKDLVIGFDARWYNRSGVGTYVFNLLQELGRIDHGCRIIAYEDPNDSVPISSPKIQRIAMRAGRYSVSGQIELARRCRQDRLDVFHAPFYIVPLLANCPVVVTVHDLIPFLFPIYGFAHRELVKAGYRMATHKAARVIAVSQTTVSDLRNILAVPEDRISMVYPAHSRSLFTQKRAPNEEWHLQNRYGIKKPYVLTLSARNWRTKNLDTALTAIARARQHSTSEFQIVAAGPEAGLNATGLRDRIPNLVATGFVPEEDLPLLYRNASVFVAVSHYEGFGIPLLEAMASGCPCVASTGGALGEVAGNAAAVHSPDDVQGIAESIVKLLEQAEHHSEMSARGIRRAAEFSYFKTAVATLNVYELAAATRR